MIDLLDELREVNVIRCETPKEKGGFGHLLYSWSVLEWAGAMAGEAGEAANLAKKITRGDFKGLNLIDRKGTIASPDMHLAFEIADTIIYADLLCALLGQSLRDVIIRKFNQTSVERGSPFFLRTK